MRFSRRSLIARGALITTAASVCDIGWSQEGQTLSVSDATAAALGYRPDATTVDRTKFSQYAPGQQCSGCMFYQIAIAIGMVLPVVVSVIALVPPPFLIRFVATMWAH